MNSLENRFRWLGLAICCVCLFAGCMGSEPSERDIKDQIQSELLRMTDNKLFDVQAIELQAGTVDASGIFRVTALCSLKFKRSIAQYVDWMLNNTTPPKGIKPAELRVALAEKLAAKFGNVQSGKSGTYRQTFEFSKQRFGWQLRSKDADKPIL